MAEMPAWKGMGCTLAGMSPVFIIYLTAKRLFWFIYVETGWVKVFNDFDGFLVKQSANRQFNLGK
jgi:hypothetical protein